MSNEIQAFVPSGIALPDGVYAEYGFRHGEEMSGMIGKHVVISFDNGYKLSVLDAFGSYGVEVGLIGQGGKMTQDDRVLNSGDSVEGWVTPERLAEIINKIAAL